MRLALVSVGCTLLLACAPTVQRTTPEQPGFELADWRLRISSNTSWSAVIGNAPPIGGRRNATYDLPDDTPTCASITKQTAEGWLRAEVQPRGQRAETRAAYGWVVVCSRGDLPEPRVASAVPD